MPKKKPFKRYLSYREKVRRRELLKILRELKCSKENSRSEETTQLINKYQKILYELRYSKVGEEINIPISKESFEDYFLWEKSSNEIYDLDDKLIRKIIKSLKLDYTNYETYIRPICVAFHYCQSDSASKKQKAIREALLASARKLQEINTILSDCPDEVTYVTSRTYHKISGFNLPDKKNSTKHILKELEYAFGIHASNPPDLSHYKRSDAHYWKLLFDLGDVYFARVGSNWDNNYSLGRLIETQSVLGNTSDEICSLREFFNIFVGKSLIGLTKSKIKNFFEKQVKHRPE